MVLHLHGMEEVGVRFSLGPQKNKKTSRMGCFLNFTLYNSLLPFLPTRQAYP